MLDVDIMRDKNSQYLKHQESLKRGYTDIQPEDLDDDLHGDEYPDSHYSNYEP